MPDAPPPLVDEPPPPSVERCDIGTCQHLGVCADATGRCGVSLQTCRRSLRCKALGFCTPEDGQCAIGANQDCKQSNACETHGLCAARGQSCVAEESFHCTSSRICAERGACTERDGACVRDPHDDAGGSMKLRSEGLRTTGIALTIAGPALGALGTALLFTDDTGGIIAGAFMAPTGGTLLLMGLPMLMLGGQEIPSNTEPQSGPALAGGIVMAALGIGGIGMGGVFFGVTDADDNALPAIPMVIGGSLLIGGLALGIYGIATQPITPQASLRVGPSSIDLTMQF
jgi:hypothetical protein